MQQFLLKLLALKNILFILTLLLAVVTIYDDIKYGIIKNRRIIQFLIAGSLTYTFTIAMVFFGYGTYTGVEVYAWSSFASQTLLNTFCGLLSAIILWQFNVWAAGDAKLFTLYCFLLPPCFYKTTFISFFPGIVLLINIFVVTFLYLLLDMATGLIPKLALLIRNRRKAFTRGAISGAIKKLISWLPFIFFLIVMFAGIRAIREAARESISPLVHISQPVVFLILFAAFKPLSKLAMKKYGMIIFLIITAGSTAFLIHKNSISSLNHLLKPGGTAILLILFARSYQSLAGVTRTIKVGQLKPGMLLSPYAIAALKKTEKNESSKRAATGEDTAHETTHQCVPQKLGPLTVDGLTSEQIRYIKTRFPDDEKITISKTFPFSPFLAAGAIITIVAKSPITSFT